MLVVLTHTRAESFEGRECFYCSSFLRSIQTLQIFRGLMFYTLPRILHLHTILIWWISSCVFLMECNFIILDEETVAFVLSSYTYKTCNCFNLFYIHPPLIFPYLHKHGCFCTISQITDLLVFTI